ncbi:tetratricopeptide repeat protein [Saccharicrinis aurantiacus]|uniref:tetratricopeptide repeat protein n=1 Tax=Saccharicrinis aurantiacus TaxID=1849719 RepID=UPI0024915C91|nr:tetratricopeptide repeat protein [Saccharicrinis aurantiacus]
MRLIYICVFSVFSFFVSAQNSDLETIVKKGREAYDAGNFEKSVKWFKQAHKFDKKSEEIMCELALSYLAHGDYTNAALYSGKVIANKKGSDFAEECYIMHGNSWDKQLRRKRAQKTYKEAIEAYPNNYLLYYHLANSLYREKKYEEAQEQLINLFKINPTYGSGHLLMAYIEYDKGERIKAMLPLYYYLLVEQDSERSEGVYDFLNNLWNQGVRVKAQRESKLYTAGVNLGDFAEQEHLLKEYEINRDTVINEVGGIKNLTLIRFAENTNYLFSSLGNTPEVNYGFYWEFYVDLFAKINRNHYSDAYSYFISDCKYKDDVLLWMSSNYQTFKKFTEWMELQ